jgi:hypothetical protein
MPKVFQLAQQKDRKEAIIQENIENYLRSFGWYVLRTHGNVFQSGFPDDYAIHVKYGARWIEVKLPGMENSRFTPAQIDIFPQLIKNGAGVWILTAATMVEYEKLFKPSNLWSYMMGKL